MDSKELMVGDWVMVAQCVADAHFRHYPDKVESISKDLVGLASDGLETILDRINPIPLTEEILMKNGFSTGKTISGTELFTCEVTHQLAGDGFEIQRITIYPKWICYIETATTAVRTGITYIHQLQHLLRLCSVEKEIEL